jgi:hypothetical protein
MWQGAPDTTSYGKVCQFSYSMWQGAPDTTSYGKVCQFNYSMWQGAPGTTLFDKVCKRHGGQSFSQSSQVCPTNKTDTNIY